MKKIKKKQIPFSEVIQALLDSGKLFPPAYLHSLSDLTLHDQQSIQKIWHKIDPKRKENLLEDLIHLAEVEMEVLFEKIARLALSDENPVIRSAGIKLLWECNDIKLVPQLLRMLGEDPDARVCAAAANALGLFVYLGELEEIDQAVTAEIEDALLAVLEGNAPTAVKLRALESLGYSNRKEISDQITKAYHSGDKEWLSSALFAMGRSLDAELWRDPVLASLDHPILDIQFEAVQAAGMLELADARQPLLDMLETYGEMDENVRMAAVTALSMIGGEDVEETLESLLDRVEDEDELEVIENAIEYLGFFGGDLPLGMFNFSDSEDDLDFSIESLEDEDDEGEGEDKIDESLI